MQVCEQDVNAVDVIGDGKPQRADAGSRIEDQKAAIGPLDRYAGRIPAVAKGVRAGRRQGTARSPECNLHSLISQKMAMAPRKRFAWALTGMAVTSIIRALLSRPRIQNELWAGRVSLRKHGEILVVVGIVFVVGLLVLPLPPFLLDLFLALSIAASLLILLVALYTSRPLDFSSFPAVLLILTLYRLSPDGTPARLRG